MLAEMEKEFPASVTYTNPKGGLFVWVTLPEGVGCRRYFRKSLR